MSSGILPVSRFDKLRITMRYPVCLCDIMAVECDASLAEGAIESVAILAHEAARIGRRGISSIHGVGLGGAVV